jgi:RNA methyltransferase, TrmH family
MRTISSRQNPSVRAFRDLARDADATGARLLLDGVHLVHDARRAGLAFETVVVAASRASRDSEEGRLAAALDDSSIDVVVAPDQVFGAMSPVASPSGIAAIVRRHPLTIDSILAISDALIVATVGIQDPGNLGSVVRAAEAFEASAVLVCGTADHAAANPFSWKALRGSMGSALRIPIAAGLDGATAIDRLRREGVRTIAAVARGGHGPETVSWARPVAVVVGGEGPGLPQRLADRCDERITIPMAANVESLNVAVAGALLLYIARARRSG